MSSAFDSIMKGLEEVKAHRKGMIKLKSRNLKIKPLSEYTSEEVKEIRNSYHFSQRIFAEIMGVSQKTVEAWESGKNPPSGTARRLLWLMEKDLEFLEKENILVSQ
ncbi:MAG: helix-turn-helix domain-containing protein [Candidatus Scalindua sp.]|nr:helix-turn-helix domain-containing protein [Candidatus Scalindua sp.]